MAAPRAKSTPSKTQRQAKATLPPSLIQSQLPIARLQRLVGETVDANGETCIPVLSAVPLPTVESGRLHPDFGRGVVRKRGAAAPTTVAQDAFEPGPRARAILRGLEIAEQDLKDSGGTYTPDEVRRLLGNVSRQRVDQLVKGGRLLAVTGPSNSRRYPTVQFNDDGTLGEGLSDVLAALPSKNPWAVLNFLIHPDARLQDRRPIDLLRQGKIDAVVAAATRMAEPGA